MMQLSSADAIPYLFERPNEPVFNRKGADGTVQLTIPKSYYTEPFKNISEKIENRFDVAPSAQYKVKELTQIPDISLAASLSKQNGFSVFNDYHQECAKQLITVFLDARSLDDFVSLSTYTHDRVNSYLWVYAMSIAILHRPDAKNIPLPSHLQYFPGLYVDRGALSSAREEGSVVPEGQRIAIEIDRDYTATNLELEHRIAYFREDVGVNLHHWHWHLVYPLEGPYNVVNKDRRGELFYYMHQQVLARYNMERMCNHLARVRRLVDFREPIEEGYYPKLDDSVAARVWPSRHPNTRLSNVYREVDHMTVDIQELERWRDRIFEAINTNHYIKPDGSTASFSAENGIDVLGNMVESTILSVNRKEYGNLHNRLHTLVSYSHDPENRFLESFGIMNESSTAMRDPVFYRVHAFITYIFEQYKHTLPPYTEDELSFKDMKVSKAEITSTGIPNNQIYTFWQHADIDLSRGLDFSEKRGSVFARVTHLQHAPFSYNITVENGSSARIGTVRIYYAPKYDEQGSTFQLLYQKGLFVELDRFTYNFQRGTNVIVRKSTDSSVTIPYEQTFRNLSNKSTNYSKEEAFNFCGCGWPHHMLIAKGNVSGFECELFVFVTDYEKDKVPGLTASKTCDDASSYCGIRDSKYPDKRPMGYPFDRLPRATVGTLKQFLTPNMYMTPIKIYFQERTVASIQKGSVSIPVAGSNTNTNSNKIKN